MITTIILHEADAFPHFSLVDRKEPAALILFISRQFLHFLLAETGGWGTSTRSPILRQFFSLESFCECMIRLPFGNSRLINPGTSPSPETLLKFLHLHHQLTTTKFCLQLLQWLQLQPRVCLCLSLARAWFLSLT